MIVPELAQRAPSGQTSQTTDSLALLILLLDLKYFGAQIQDSIAVCAVVPFVLVFSGHCSHCSRAVAPLFLEYVSIGQSTHWVEPRASLYCPILHC